MPPATGPGLDALALMGAQYNELLADRTALLLQLQGFAACGDGEVRDAVRAGFARMWQTVSEVTGLAPVTVKAFLAFGMLLNSNAALPARQAGRAVGGRGAHAHQARPVRAHHGQDEPLTATSPRSERQERDRLPRPLADLHRAGRRGHRQPRRAADHHRGQHVRCLAGQRAQWTLTIALLSGAVAIPLLGRLGAGPRRRATIIGTLAVVAGGSVLTVLPLSFGWLLARPCRPGRRPGTDRADDGRRRDHL